MAAGAGSGGKQIHLIRHIHHLSLSGSCRLVECFHQFLQIISEGGANIVAAQAEFDVGFDKAELVADVVAAAAENAGLHGFLRSQCVEGVGELDLAAFSWCRFSENVEDRRRDDVAA